MSADQTLAPPDPYRWRTVIWDMDGVIVDSEATHRDATLRYLESLGHELDDNLLTAMVGRRVRDLAELLAPSLHLTPEEILAGREAVFWRLIEDGLPAMPGLFEALDRLAAAGLSLAVGSSGTGVYVEHTLRALGIRDHFRAVVSGDDVALGKPDPDIYLLAARRLGLDPSACIVIEDAPAGVLAAHRAGMQVIAVPNEATRGGDFSPALLVAGSLDEAVSCILGLAAQDAVGTQAPHQSA